MSKTVRILLIEDSERDAALLLLYLRRGGYTPTVQRVETAADMKSHLEAAEWDVVISDFNLPGFNARAALEVLKEKGRDIPFIVLSGGTGDDTMNHIKKAGAADFLLKAQMAKIVSAIERAIGSGS